MENYRFDIQGMRALAVVLVYFAHVGSVTFSGGFVGVDVFFVISGYVITQMLLKPGRLDSGHAFLEFFAARLKRLLPALLCMLAVTSLGIFWLLPELEGVQQYKAATGAAMWLSNFFFLWSETDYFGGGAASSAFLHTWSLAVEEQFYLLWPVVLAFGLGNAPRLVGNGSRVLLFTLIGISLASFIFSLWLAGSKAFYMMPARAWQFGLGALVAYLHVTHGGLMLRRWLVNALGLLGLAGVILAAVLFDNSTPYPDWYVLLPSLGATMLLLSGYQNTLAWPNMLLTLRPIRWLGDISYSFYLWHWPVLFFFWVLNPYYPQLEIWHTAFVTLGLAALSFYAIETPLRRNVALTKRPLLTLLGALFATCTFIYSVNYLREASLNSSGGNAPIKEASINLVPEIYQYGCDEWYISDRVVPCEPWKAPVDKTVVMIGDSILAQWYPAVAEHYKKLGWRLIVLTKSSCPMVNRPYFYTRIKSEFKVCDSWREKALQYIVDLKPTMVILGSAPRYPFSKSEWVDGTREILEQLAPSVENIKLIAGTPGLPFNGRDCIARLDHINERIFLTPRSDACSSEYRALASNGWLKGVASEYSSVDFIDLNSKVCPNEVCSAQIDGKLVFRDGQHLTVGFVMQLADSLGDALSEND